MNFLLISETMKFSKNSLILLLFAFLLTIGVSSYEIYRQKNQLETKQTNPKLFTFTKDDIQSLKIQLVDRTISFEKNNDPTIPWLMAEPEKSPANEASIAFLTDLLERETISQTFPISPQEIKDYGFDRPLAEIIITLNNKQTHHLVLGKATFDNQKLYSQIDPPSSQNTRSIALVSIDFEYAINRPLSEWKKAP